MKVKLDNYEIDILINGLFQRRGAYDAQTNSAIDDLLLQIVQKVKNKELRRRHSFRFEHHEARVIRQCLIRWRNQQLQTQKQGTAEAISELIILFTY